MNIMAPNGPSGIVDRLKCLSTCARFSVFAVALALGGICIAWLVTADTAYLKIGGVALWFIAIYAALNFFFPRSPAATAEKQTDQCHAR